MSQTILQVFSPDGFSIIRGKTYNSPEDAREHYTKWAKRFEIQGYYSSNTGRIPLDELEQACVFKVFDKSKCNGLELEFLSKD